MDEWLTQCLLHSHSRRHAALLTHLYEMYHVFMIIVEQSSQNVKNKRRFRRQTNYFVAASQVAGLTIQLFRYKSSAQGSCTVKRQSTAI